MVEMSVMVYPPGPAHPALVCSYRWGNQRGWGRLEKHIPHGHCTWYTCGEVKTTSCPHHSAWGDAMILCANTPAPTAMAAPRSIMTSKEAATTPYPRPNR